MSPIDDFKREYELLIIGALLLTASLMWKDILVDIMNVFFPLQSGLSLRIFYTIIISCTLVFISVYLKQRDELDIESSEIESGKVVKSHHNTPSTHTANNTNHSTISTIGNHGAGLAHH